MYLGRDSGWIQFGAFNAQEAYDLALCAFKVAENHDVRLPVMVHQDGFITSHTAQNVYPLTDEIAYGFVGDIEPVDDMLDFSRPVTYGAQTEEDWHFEHKAKQHKAIMDSVTVIDAVFEEFEKLSGRKYNRIEEYDMEDADVCVIGLGTTVESARVAAKEMRAEGIKAGVVAIRCFRPFPYEEIREALEGVKSIAVTDRSSPGGAMGAFYNEVAAAMATSKSRPMVTNYIYGLGGRDISIENLKDIYKEQQANADAGYITTDIQQFTNLRGPHLGFFKTARG
jgi:pyruvate ferredoxin oxidoreductase alpha subunit